MDFDGVYPPLITPTMGRQEIDTTQLANHVSNLSQAGVDGFFPCGTVGEFSSLSSSQRESVIHTVVSASGNKTVLAGCGGNSVEEVRNQIDTAESVGADAAVVIAPYYFGVDDSGIKRYFKSIINDAPLPIVLYNIPFLTGNNISIDSVISLAEHENVVGIKDSSGDPRYHSRLNSETGDGFTVLQGITDQAVMSLRGGTDGLIPGVSNLAPKAIVDLYQATQKGNYEEAVDIQATVVNNVLYALDGVSLTAGLKFALQECKFDVGQPLPPLSHLSDHEKCQIRDRLALISDEVLYPSIFHENE